MSQNGCSDPATVLTVMISIVLYLNDSARNQESEVKRPFIFTLYNPAIIFNCKKYQPFLSFKDHIIN